MVLLCHLALQHIDGLVDLRFLEFNFIPGLGCLFVPLIVLFLSLTQVVEVLTHKLLLAVEQHLLLLEYLLAL